MDSITIGKRLKSVRESLGFTQEQVAKYTETSREAISYIETGARSVNTLMLQKIADLYGYKLLYFIEEVIKEDKPYVATAFRIRDLSDKDLEILAHANRIVMNLDSLHKLLEAA